MGSADPLHLRSRPRGADTEEWTPRSGHRGRRRSLRSVSGADQGTLRANPEGAVDKARVVLVRALGPSHNPEPPRRDARLLGWPRPRRINLLAVHPNDQP